MKPALTESGIFTPSAAGAGAFSIEYWPLSAGAAGTFQTLALMAAAVRGECPPDFSGYRDEWNLRAAEQITRKANHPVHALFEFTRDQIEYVLHPPNEQRVQDCRRTIEICAGDCVSKSVCLATLLAALNYRPRFVAQSIDGKEFSHVYVEAFFRGDWHGLDPVAEDKPAGWRQPLPDGGFETTWEIF